MTLTLVIIALLWRTRERGLVLVRHAMVLFFFGEGMCTVNYVFAAGLSDGIELFHGLGMAGMGCSCPGALAARRRSRAALRGPGGDLRHAALLRPLLEARARQLRAAAGVPRPGARAGSDGR